MAELAAAGRSDRRRWSIAREAHEVADARHAIGELARKTGLADDLADDLELSGAELVNNAVLHGAGRRVAISAGIATSKATGGRVFRIEVRDAGKDPIGAPAATDLAETGRGHQIVEALMSRWGIGRVGPGVIAWCEADLP